jgi:hypothetical protein
VKVTASSVRSSTSAGVDDDPRTAEVVSKVVMLARDHKIKDPTILEQLGTAVP